jgi:small subunit ribosomal protein S8
MMTDPIADMLTRIRNASTVFKTEVELPYSKIKKALADILVSEGYLVKVEEVKDSKPTLVLTLKYKNKQPAISNIKRISKPGYRKYIKSKEIKKVLNGYGMSIMSTPKGLVTGVDARKQGLGGEIICEIW